jgi:hypothetical protein
VRGRKVRALARVAAERKEDARIDTLLRLGVRARPYSGDTPADAHPKYVRPYTMGEHQTRARLGHVERRGDSRTFVKDPPGGRDPIARPKPRSYGGPLGDAIVDDRQPSLLTAGTQAPQPKEEE